MDWIDIGIHAGIAAAYVVIPPFLLSRAYALLYVPLLAFGVVFWPFREVIQHWPDPLEIVTQIQSLLEWIIPSVIVFLGMEYLAYKINSSWPPMD